MTEDEVRPGDVSVGDVSGQVTIGNDNTQWQQRDVTQHRHGVSETDMAELRAAVTELRAQVMAAAPDLAPSASERLDELDRAVVTDKPNLNTLQYVRDWLTEHVPQVAGTVTSLVFHPILGRLVEAAGDSLVAEFRQRFGTPGP